jgi:hypothetical protein
MSSWNFQVGTIDLSKYFHLRQQIQVIQSARVCRCQCLKETKNNYRYSKRKTSKAEKSMGASISAFQIDPHGIVG